MATPAGVWILDDAHVDGRGDFSADEDISGFCAQAMVSIQNTWRFPLRTHSAQDGQVTTVSSPTTR